MSRFYLKQNLKFLYIFLPCPLNFCEFWNFLYFVNSLFINGVYNVGINNKNGGNSQWKDVLNDDDRCP